MSAVVATGWEMYDLRSTIKAVTGEAIGIGMCCYIHSDGLIYVSDTDEDKCHGCALKAAALGDSLVLVLEGRLRVQTAQTPGANVMSQQLASGTGSAPDDAGAGPKVGFATAEYIIQVNIDSVSTT